MFITSANYILMVFQVFLCFLIFIELRSERIYELRIGGLFQNENEEFAFRVAVDMINEEYTDFPFKLIPDTVKIRQYNAFSVHTGMCKLLPKGIVAIFGPSSIHSSSYIQAILDRKEIPHIETHWDRKLQRNNCLLNLYPHPSVVSQAYIDLVVKWNWRSLIIIYENEESLSRISGLLSLNADYGILISLKQLDATLPGDYIEALINVRKTGETNFILDCSNGILKEVLKQAQQVGLMTERYNYIITNLDLQTNDLALFQFSGTNITGFRMVDPENSRVIKIAGNILHYKATNKYFDEFAGWKLKLQAALLIDSVELFAQAIMDLTISKQFIIKPKPLYCNTTNNWNGGHTIVNYMKRKTVEGLTGLVKFDNEGFRRDISLDILELKPEGLSKIGTWNSTDGLDVRRMNVPEKSQVEEGSLINKTFIIITCLTPPYGMLKETTTQLFGNDRFEGFGIDLIDELSKLLGFNYTIIIQEDGYNGNYNPETREWDGLIGKIIRGDAHLAIADLTITAERESVVDFTLQFMNLGISILYKKPKPVPPSLFMFASPFSNNVWLLLGGTYFLVSLIFFVMGRLSPSEWTNPYPCIEEPEYLINQFNIKNSFWFTIGSLMQQGTEIAPIGISTRTAAGVWWFFCLIMVSSYTANLAAFLTVETLVTPFTNVKELAEHKEIKYGAKRGGATENFFKNAGDDPVRNKIWSHMMTHDEEMTESNDEGVERVEKENYAFFMESTTIEYVVERHCSLSSVGAPLDDKGYAIAMKKNSSYRNDLSAAILKLQETGKITALKEKWWKEKRGAGKCDSRAGESAATPLNLQNVGGVFLVLFIGTVISFFGSLIELAICIYAKVKNSNISFKDEFKKEMKFFIQFKENVKPALNYSNENANQ